MMETLNPVIESPVLRKLDISRMQVLPVLKPLTVLERMNLLVSQFDSTPPSSARTKVLKDLLFLGKIHGQSFVLNNKGTNRL